MKYLGRLFSADGGDTALEARITSAWRQFWAYKETLLEKTLSQKRRLALLEQLVQPVLLFSTESLELTQTQVQRIKVTRRSMQRKVMGCWFHGEGDTDMSSEEELSFAEWMQLSTNMVEDTLDDLGCRRWEEEAMRRKWRWTGHVVRRGGDWPFLKILGWSGGRRKRSGPGAPR